MSNNKVTTLAGSSSGVVEGVGTAAKFQIPWGVKLSADGNHLYVSSWNGNAISKVRLSDNNVTILGRSKSNMSLPRGLYISPANQVFLANTGGHYISKIQSEADGNASTFVKVTGGTSAGDVDGNANAARLSGPVGIAYDPYIGMFYIADGDGSNQKVRTMKSSDIQ
ncbi:NHL repeat protein [compost metagenome]